MDVDKVDVLTLRPGGGSISTATPSSPFSQDTGQQQQAQQQQCRIFSPYSNNHSCWPLAQNKAISVSSSSIRLSILSFPNQHGSPKRYVILSAVRQPTIAPSVLPRLVLELSHEEGQPELRFINSTLLN